MLNKKGLAVHWFMMIGYVAGIMVFLMILGYLVMNAFANAADTHQLEYYLAFDRLIYSKDSVFYYDSSIDRIYPGIVDLNRLYEDRLGNLFGDNKDFGVRLSMGEGNSTYDLFYNRNIYEAGEYVFTLKNPIYGGLRYKLPVAVKEQKNDILLMGLMYKK